MRRRAHERGQCPGPSREGSLIRPSLELHVRGPDRILGATMNPVIQTCRMQLRQMHMGDLDFVAAMMAHPEVMRFYPCTFDRARSREWVRQQVHHYRHHGHGLWLAEDRWTGQPLGQVGLVTQVVEGVEEVELAYLIHRPYWGLGLATEAARACRDHAFGPLGCRFLVSLIHPANVASQRVATRLGMQRGISIMHAGSAHIVFAMLPAPRPIPGRRPPQTREVPALQPPLY